MYGIRKRKQIDFVKMIVDYLTLPYMAQWMQQSSMNPHLPTLRHRNQTDYLPRLS
jgi:hypothetical protein